MDITQLLWQSSAKTGTGVLRGLRTTSDYIRLLVRYPKLLFFI